MFQINSLAWLDDEQNKELTTVCLCVYEMESKAEGH